MNEYLSWEVDLIERIETLESVAKSLPEQDERRSALLDLVEKDLAGAPALRPRIAAELLGLSEKTVKMHRASLLTRLGVGSSAEAIRVGVEAGVQLSDPG